MNESTQANSSGAAFDGIVSFVLFHTPADEIARAVRQVQASSGSYKIVLVDNSEPKMDLARAADLGVEIIQAPGNVGYGAGHNLALSKFRGAGRYNFILNTDITFPPSALAKLTAFLDDRPDVGIAMPVVTYPDGSPQPLCRLLPRPIDIAARALSPNSRFTRTLNRRYEFQAWNYDEPLNFPFLSGCFLAIRSASLELAGAFDERFFMFAEDLDLTRRVHRLARTVLCPHVHITHEYRTRSQQSWIRRKYLIQSFIRYFNKYGWIYDSERDEINRRTLWQFEGRERA